LPFIALQHLQLVVDVARASLRPGGESFVSIP